MNIEEIEKDLSILIQRRMELDGAINYLQGKLNDYTREQNLKNKEEEQIEE